MLSNEMVEAIEQFYKRREARLRRRLDQTEDLVGKYRILKAIHNNRKSERRFWGEQNEDGGPGSGNFGHEGVPGQVGGSAPSGAGLNEKVRHAAKKGYLEADRQLRSVLKDAPVGIRFKQNGVGYTKTAENEFISDDGRKANINYIANGVNITVESSIPQFEDVKSVDIAAQKLQNGEISAKETTVKIPSMEPRAYKGAQIVDVSKEQFQSLREELQNNTGKAVTNDEIEEYLGAIDTYRGANYSSVVAASAGFSGGYEGYSSSMSDERKNRAVSQADAIERFIKSADKYDGKVMRALGFDLGGEYDDGSTTKQFENLINKCKPGEELDMGHISSWTTQETTVGQILGARTGNDETAERSVQVIFTCQKSSNGVDIGRFSKELTQGEVVFSKDQRFRVKSVKQKEIGDDDWPVTKYEIEVEEVMP